MMNVLVTATTFPKRMNDSAPRFVYDLCNALLKKGRYIPIVLVPHSVGSKSYEKINGLEIYRYRYFFEKFEMISGNGIVSNIKNKKVLALLIPFLIIGQLTMAVHLIKKYKIEIIVANWIIPQALVAVLVKLLLFRKVKIVVISHGGDAALLNKNKYFKLLGLWILNRVDIVVAVSSFIRDLLYKIRSSQDNIPVISMGVDTKSFSDGINVNTSEKEFDVIFIGRLEAKKGIAYLIEALNILQDKMTIKTIIVGNGTEYDKLKTLVEDFNLQDNVFFTGALSHSQIKPYITKSKIFVAPSINLSDDTEGMPTVLLEAMSAGLPIITTDAGGICDVIRNNQNGIIVKQRDSGALADKISYLLKCPNQANRLKLNGLKSSQEFSYENIAKKYEDVIGDIK